MVRRKPREHWVEVTGWVLLCTCASTAFPFHLTFTGAKVEGGHISHGQWLTFWFSGRLPLLPSAAWGMGAPLYQVLILGSPLPCCRTVVQWICMSSLPMRGITLLRVGVGNKHLDSLKWQYIRAWAFSLVSGWHWLIIVDQVFVFLVCYFPASLETAGLFWANVCACLLVFELLASPAPLVFESQRGN